MTFSIVDSESERTWTPSTTSSSPGDLFGGLGPGEAATNVDAREDQVRNPLGVAYRIRDCDGSTLRHAKQGEAFQTDRVHNEFEIVDESDFISTFSLCSMYSFPSSEGTTALDILA